MNMRIQIYFPNPAFSSLEYTPRSGIPESYDKSIFNCLRNCHTVFHTDYSISHSHQQCTKFQFFHIPMNTCCFLSLIAAILMGMRWYLIVVLICISLIICDVGHLFMCLLAICKSSLEKCPFRSLPTFDLGCLDVCFFFLLSFRGFLSIWDINPLPDM